MSDATPPVDDRPEPKYGQYAPLPASPAAPVGPPLVAPPPAEAAPAVAAPNRTRDVVVTTVLLLIGVVDVVTGFATFADFGPSLTLVYRQLGIDGTASSALAAPYGAAINAVRIAVLAVTVVVSLLLIARRRRAFWAPLAGYVLAAIITSVLVATVMLNDPAYQAWLAQYQ
jgi:hypothetical protein